MGEPSKSTDVSLVRIILFILGFAQLLALTEILSLPLFWALIKPGGELELIVRPVWLLDSIYSKQIRLNLIAYLSVALLASLLLSPLGLLLKKRGWGSTAGGVYFGASASCLLSFASFTFFQQLLFFVVPWLRSGNVFFVSISALGVLLVIMKGTLWGMKRWQGLETGFFLGLAIHLVINFLRVCLMNFVKLTLKNFGLALAGVAVILGIGLALGVLLSRVRRNRAWLAGVERVALAGFLALGILMISIPALQWGEILLARGPAAAPPSGAAGSQPASGPGGGSASPNVIMIVWDTARADHLSLYGYPRPTTPFLERLAAEAVVFDRAYASSPWTIPSHASFFTGLYPSEHHCSWANLRLSSEFTTLAETFRENGYATLAISNNAALSPFTGFDQGFHRFVESSRLGFPAGELAEWIWTLSFHPQYLQDSGAERTQQILSHWVKRLAQSRAPFFLFINYVETHIPYPTVEVALQFFPDPKAAKKNFARTPLDWDYYNCNPKRGAGASSEIQAWYDGAISYLDQQLGRLYVQLEKAGLLDQTILIVLSDHGESLGERDYFGHDFFLYEPLLHVPLVIYYPKLLSPGRIAHPVSLVRLPSLILDLIHHQMPAVLAAPPEGSVPLYAEVSPPLPAIAKLKGRCPQGFDTRRMERNQKAVLQWPYKLIWDSQEADELYQIATDPEEGVNLVEQDRGIYRQLQHLINLFRAAHPETESAGPLVLDYQTKKALEALGYARPLRQPEPSRPSPPGPP
jgi:arylsulfatase A-like enzyme